MCQKVSKSASSVQEELEKLNLNCRVITLPSSTRTAAEAAKSIGCNISQIVKSLVFKTKETEKVILILASGSNQVNTKILEAILNEYIIKADANFVRDITGFAIGGIPPIGHKNSPNLTFIDSDLLNHDEIWAAAGTPNSIFCIKSADLLKATNGRLINIK
jgi:prolyl-tRNA editing enzyme YbaK/EbsC (Cys-tRNA(Pro) deacylase)